MLESTAVREKTYAAESGIAGIRVAVILLNSAAYLFGMDRTGTYPLLAYAIIVTAIAYSVSVYVLKPYKRFEVMLSSYFTTALDAAFITVWISATGGLESPFHLLWLLSIGAIAFRYDARATLTAAAVYSACYVGLLAFADELFVQPTDVILRIGYIFLMAAVGALMARETYTQTAEKVRMRSLAEALRESEERFRLLSEAAFEGIAIHDDGRIIEVNDAFGRLFAAKPDVLVGKSLFDLVHPSAHDEVRRRIAARSNQPYEITARAMDGTTLDVEVVGRDSPMQGRMLRVVAVRDISVRKKAIREAEEREALAAANERLREMDVMKSQFINNAAHELGTPLTPIRLQAHLLYSERLGPLTKDQSRAIGVLRRNVEHLSLMVKDLLDASRIESGHLELAPRNVDLSQVLRDAVETYQPTAQEKAIDLSLEANEGIDAVVDPHRVTQVVFNLLANAVKFTPPDGEVRVRLYADEHDAIIEVDDTGTGIAATDLAKLFQPFSQVHDKMEQTRSGAGLGLFIARGIVEAHGGRIAAASRGAGSGSTFTFALPRRGRPEGPIQFSPVGLHVSTDEVE